LGITAFAQSTTFTSDFEFSSSWDGVTIIGYKGSAATVNIPAFIYGLPVTVIEDSAFWGCGWLTSITIPDGVTYIGNDTKWIMDPAALDAGSFDAGRRRGERK
jgi:hypothetical protein